MSLMHRVRDNSVERKRRERADADYSSGKSSENLPNEVALPPTWGRTQAAGRLLL